MQSKATTVKDYMDELPADRKVPVKALRDVIKINLPIGFKEEMNGMIVYFVPHSLYPDGYHCDPAQPLPFAGIASQKNFVALYHMGIYSDTKLQDWFVKEYPKYSKQKLDMGKSCVRFKKMDQIPFDLIGQLMSKMSVDDWIKLYEKNRD